MITQLIYYSSHETSRSAEGPLSTMRSIISSSRRNNGRDGITGYLIFDRRWFLQILEGQQAAIAKTFARISNDRRHGGIQVISQQPSTRVFSDWSMAGSLLSPEHEGIFLRHGLNGMLEPARLKAATVLSLAQAIQSHDASRRSVV